MLHLKRPWLFPVLDLLVAEMPRSRISPTATAAARAEQATRLLSHLRREGREKFGALEAIQRQLPAIGIERSLVRILDAMLWLSAIALLVGAELNAEAERSRELRRGEPAELELQAPAQD
jgi:hypothetical protein